jgi:hypothetical protein
VLATLADGIGLGNAGQVIVTPYLPRLFGILGLTEEGRFASPAQAERACLLLQYLVNGHTHTAEHELPLNKLLCGLDLRHPVDAQLDITQTEASAVDGLLRAVIAHWGALGHTSVAGLRETFLQRPGQLAWRDDAWQLQVPKKTVDILMERLPWGFSIIRHSWMPQPIMVQWL